jgi:protein TonB
MIPPWQPGTGLSSQIGYNGAVRLTIDATGKVTNAVMDPSVYPPYDRLVLAAARDWIYRPATQDGQPVASQRLVEIVLRPR